MQKTGAEQGRDKKAADSKGKDRGKKGKTKDAIGVLEWLMGGYWTVRSQLLLRSINRQPDHNILGEIRQNTGGGAWCPKNQVNMTTREWLEISFDKDYVVTAIETQGRYDEGRGVEFAAAYKIEYWRSSIDRWVQYRDDAGLMVIPANSDTHTAVLRILGGSIIARKIRILPVSNSTRTVCMRLELYGCQYKDALVSYSAPEGSSEDNLHMFDTTYDGDNLEGQLVNGLGKLFDGFIGEDNFELHPHKWIGWSASQAKAPFIELRFTFADSQNISAILLHSSNAFEHNAPAFSLAEIFFSLNGVNFSDRIIKFEYIKDRKKEAARWIRIPIADRIAKVVQVRLYFTDYTGWLLLSEVQFEFNKIRFQLPLHETSPPHSVTYYSIEDPSSAPVPVSSSLVSLGLLLLFFAIVIVILCTLFQHKRDRVKATSPSPTFNARRSEIHLTVEGSTIKRTSPSTYQMTKDNIQNAILEKVPLPSGCLNEEISDYAEPYLMISSSSDHSATIPLLQNMYGSTIYEGSTYPALSQYNPLSAIVKYSDYGEVYCTTLPEIARGQLTFIEKIGQGEFGEVHLCQLESRKVAVKRLHSTDPGDELAFQREIRALGTLKHPCVVEVIGVSTIEKPMLCIMEHMENGDLKTYFQKLDRIDTSLCISICTQLAAGLAYLESCHFVHRDIAARNCLVDKEGNVKISDFGMARSLYSSEYYKVEGKFVLPIRWMAWETLLQGKFSCASDVWAFGVTMFEVFSRCEEKPLAQLTDEQVIDNLQFMHCTRQLRTVLRRPHLCPMSLYSQLILPCWNYEPSSRPTFASLHLQLQSLIHSNLSS
ncbi:hypothetical protein WR25_10309 [Diploscapter pachys]|uniref:Protein kinase domain-containing protein n=1 Tax=Diploscapter pachys TaxID=2018661 RepID=A0A2A2KYR8_9BILA|nr:hypothetical protein WR25_10309 [Diploscapter pachys]